MADTPKKWADYTGASAAPDWETYNPSTTAGDVAKAGMAGFAGLAEAAGKGLRYLGAEESGKWLQQLGSESAQSWIGWMTPAGQRALGNEIITDELSFGETPWQTLTLQAAMSLPSMIATAPVGFGAARGIEAIGGKALETLATRPGTIGFLARFLPSATAYGGAEGAVAALQNAAQTESEFLSLPIESLRSNPNFQRLYGQTDGNLPQAQREQQAREGVARLASDEVAWKTFAATGGIGALTGGGALGGLDRALTAKAGDGILKSVAKGAAQEALQETPQSASEQYIQNKARQDFANGGDPTKGVVAAGLSGGIVGGVMGGAFGGAGALANRRRTDDEAAADTINAIAGAKTVDEAIAAATAAVNAPDDIVPPPTTASAVPAGIDPLTGEIAGEPFTPTPGENITLPPGTPTTQPGIPGDVTATADPATVTAVTTAIDDKAHEAATSDLNDLPQPTEAQKEAGNYKKGHVMVGGLDVSVENPAGTKRRPEWPTLESHYGYVKGVAARAPDKEHVDVFVRPGTAEDYAGKVYVVDQANAKGGFDEPKVMVGYVSQDEATTAYLKNYTPGWQSRVMGVTELSMEQFRQRLADPAGFLTPSSPQPVIMGKLAREMTDKALLQALKAGSPNVKAIAKAELDRRAGSQPAPDLAQQGQPAAADAAPAEAEDSLPLPGANPAQWWDQDLNTAGRRKIVAASDVDDGMRGALTMMPWDQVNSGERKRLIAAANKLAAAKADAEPQTQATEDPPQTEPADKAAEPQNKTPSNEGVSVSVDSRRDSLLALIDAKEGMNAVLTIRDKDARANAYDEAKAALESAKTSMREAYGQEESTPLLAMPVSELYDLYEAAAGTSPNTVTQPQLTDNAESGKAAEAGNDPAPDTDQKPDTGNKKKAEDKPPTKKAVRASEKMLFDLVSGSPELAAAVAAEGGESNAETIRKALDTIYGKALSDNAADAPTARAIEAAYTNLKASDEFVKAIADKLAKAKKQAEVEANRNPEDYKAALADALDVAKVGDQPEMMAAFQAGWDHALAGKTKSTLTGELLNVVQKGYEAGKAWIQTETGKSWYEGKRRNKLENTGADLRRWFDEQQARLEAMKGESHAVWKEVDRMTDRARLFEPAIAADATPGARRYIAEVRSRIMTYRDWIFGNSSPMGFRAYFGRRTTFEKKIQEFLAGNFGSKFDTDEKRVKFFRESAAEYLESVRPMIEALRGQKTVMEAAQAIQDAFYTVDGSKVERKEDEQTKKLFQFVEQSWKFARSMVPAEAKSEYSFLQQALRGEQTVDTVTRRQPLTPPRLDRVERKGFKDHRKGRDVTPREVKDTFGFADVGFGKWVGAKQDQDHLNYAYDAFMDMAEMLDMPPKQVGLGGTLHLTIGALGHGKHAAHYAPNQPHPDGGTVPVINLTNTQGDGTVWHEWSHALDYHLGGGTPTQKSVSVVVRNLSVTYSLEYLEKRVKDFLGGGYYYKGSKNDEVGNLQRNMRYSSNSGETEFKKEADKLGKDYWGNERELFARASEAYAWDKMGERRNTYLVNPWVADGATKPPAYRGTPYPVGSERARFAQYFDALFKSLEWTEKGPQLNTDRFKELMPDEQDKFDAKRQDIARNAANLQRDLKAEKEREGRIAALAAEAAERSRLEEEARKAAAQPAQPQSELSENDLDSIFDEAAAELRESTQEQPDAPEPGDNALGETVVVDKPPPGGWTEADKVPRREGKKSANDPIPASVREHFAVGNIVYSGYWRNHDRVLDLRAQEPGGWKVQVQRVKKEGDAWVATEPPRWHSTMPAKNDRVVERAPEAAPDAPADAAEQSAAKMAAEAAKLGVEGIDEALKGLTKLFGGGKIQTFPGGFDEDAYKQAKPHFETALVRFQAAGKTLKDLFKFLIQQFGEGIKPYAIRFAKDRELTAQLAPAGNPGMKVAEWVKSALDNGTDIRWQELFKQADTAYGGTQAEGKYTPKDAYDGLEAGVNLYLRSGNWKADGGDLTTARMHLRNLSRILDMLPTQSKRTAEMDEFQQFSTPPTYAYVANWAANIRWGETMMEPSAGVGGLAIFAGNQGAKLVLNELSGRRAALLQTLFPNARHFREDAAQINNILPQDIRPTVVVMNPPFSATAGRVPGKRDTMEGAKHIEQALKRLADRGRLVAIVGEGMADDRPAFRDWWDRIKKEYNVRANIGIDGAGYAKYGTTFDNQILVIDKDGATDTVVTGKVKDVAEALDLLEGIRNDRPRAVDTNAASEAGESAADQPGGAGTAAGGLEGRGSVDPALPGTDAVGAGGRAGTGIPADSGRAGGEGAGTAGNAATGSDAVPDGQRGRSGLRGAVPGQSGRTDAGGRGDAAAANAGGQDGGNRAVTGATVEQADVQAEGELTDSIFENYRPQRLQVPGAKEHPGVLVQSAAMAAVLPPAPTYTPNLPKAVIDKGLLSLAQIEAVVYAGQAHEQFLPDGERRGFFIGDGTGVGKGREISGIILDNFRQGRTRAVWISEKQELMADAERDFEGVSGDPSLIVNLSKYKGAISLKKGILFTTYDTLKSGKEDESTKKKIVGQRRIDQIVQWLGADFDGVIVFDEAHNMGNAVEMKGKRGKTKPSEKALAGVELQKLLPQARVVYVSATGATEVDNLSYTKRLGLWGEGTAFSSVQDFVNKVAAAGVSAMELVARDMKAMGNYIARSLTFDGITYDRVEHNLSDLQRDAYNTMAGAWQTVLQNFNAAMEESGQNKNGRAKAGVMSAFWGAHQRFFNQLITSMQMPSVIESARRDLEAGHAVVLQMVNTNEAEQERQAAKREEEEDDGLEFGPMDGLIDFVRKTFPTQQYEEYEDENGNTRTRPVVNSAGAPVENQELIAKREQLIKDLEQIGKSQAIPGNPLDLILEAFGTDKVAEVTGRGRRFVRERENGEIKIREEKRGNKAASADAAMFQGDKKQVLVFSDAGGTGFSFHADRSKKNQKKRIHYLVQPGWRADKAMQGFGRTNRTNQAHPPEYRLVTTDLKAQKRFISSIARRLDQLGALTKGERRTASQGLFSSADNLESSYAHAAMRQTLEDLLGNRVPGLEFYDLMGQMGLSIIDPKTNKLAESKIPEVPQFLNRLLSLNMETQAALFDAFAQRMDELVQKAQAEGTYDDGMQTLRAQKVEKLSDEIVFEEARTKAQSRYVKLNVTNPNKLIPWATIEQEIAANDPDAYKGVFRDNRTGKVFALFDRGARVSPEGKQYRVGSRWDVINGRRFVDNVDTVTDLRQSEVKKKIKGKVYEGEELREIVKGGRRDGRTMYSTSLANLLAMQGRGDPARMEEILAAENPDASEMQAAQALWARMKDNLTDGEVEARLPHYERIEDSEAPAAWQAAIEEAPKTHSETVHLVTGAILPIWDRFPDMRTQVVRTQTVSNERLLGRVIPSKQLKATLQNLGVNEFKNAGPAEVLQRVMDGDAVVLSNGWVVKKARVLNDSRIEIQTRGLTRGDEQILRNQGAFIERIEWKDRVFVPTGPEGEAVMTRIMQNKSVAEIVPGSGGTRFMRARNPERLRKVLRKDGKPVFGSREIALVRPKTFSNDENLLIYDIFDARYVEAGVSEAKAHVGQVELEIGPDGDILGLSFIKIRDDLQAPKRVRQAMGDRGYGEKVIRAILSTIPDGQRLRIYDILSSARGFWEKMGTNFEQGRILENGDITRQSYERSRGAIGAGDSDLAFSRGSGNEASADRGRAGGTERGSGASGDPREINALRYPTSPANAGLSVSAIRRAADAVTKGWVNAPRVEVITSMTEAPAEARALDMEQAAGGASAPPMAFFARGRVYLVAAAIKAPEQVVHAIFHEALGHYGLRGLYGRDLNRILAEVSMTRRVDVRAKALEYGLDPSKEADLLHAAEEVLAELAETRPNLGIVQRAIAAIRKFLRSIGVRLDVTDADIIANYIMPARNFVERGGVRSTSAGLMPAAAMRGDQMSLDEVLEEYGEQVDNRVIAERRFSSGDRIFLIHELDEAVHEANGVIELNAYAPDQMIVVPKEFAHLLPASDSSAAFARAGQTSAPEFRRWFGDSKVVDADGKPLVVYHGTNAKIEKFKPSKSGVLGSGIYFTTDPNAAEEFTYGKKSGGNILPVYLSLKNPYLYTHDRNAGTDPGIAILSKVFDSRRAHDIVRSMERARTDGFGGELKEKLESMGHDGIVVTYKGGVAYGGSQEIVAFRPEQIKSAIGNRGTFSPSDPDIRFSRSAMKSVEANIQRGREAMNRVLLERADVNRAMHRVGLGWVDFVWGDSEKGIAHILKSRTADGMTQDDLSRLLTDRIVTTIASGTEIRRREIDGSVRAVIAHGDHEAVLVKNRGANSWLLTGWRVRPGAPAEANDTAGATQRAADSSDSAQGAGLDENGITELRPGDMGRGATPSMPTLDAPIRTRDTEGAGGVYDTANPDIRFQRSAKTAARELLTDVFESSRTFNRWWHGTVGTQQHKAKVNPAFGAVYDEAQDFMADISMFANEAADRAPDLLPRIDEFSDLNKKSADPKDIEAATRALYAGTLAGGGSPLRGEVWTDSQLRQQFKLTDRQIQYYRQALSSVNKALEDLAKSLIHRQARLLDITENRDFRLTDFAQAVREKIEQSDSPRAAEALKAVDDIEKKALALMEHGYFPAMRFGRYAVQVVEPDEDGSPRQVYFSLYETQFEANRAARALREEFPGGRVVQAVMSQEGWRLYQGLSLDALETFAEHMVDDTGKPILQDAAIQEFLRAAVSDRSAMKRHIHRSGIAGYSKDMQRVLAHFTLSAARAASSNYHMTPMLQKADAIRAGDVKDEAVKLVTYLRDPQEEAAWVRGFLFFQFLGGSVASAAVNMTQPAMVTAPFLSQFVPYQKAAAAVAKAAKDVATHARLDPGLQAALDKAKEEGIVSPQEIHQLRAEAERPVGANLGMRKFMHVWGSLFSLAEQFNRATTFVAAYRLASQTKGANAFEFARNAVEETQFVYNKGCVDEETECLTANGWKKRADLKTGEWVYAVDENGHLVESLLEDVHVYPGKQTALEFVNTNGLSMVLTPEHKCLIQNYSSRDQKYQKPRLVRADAVKNSHQFVRVPLGDATDRIAAYSDDEVRLFAWVAAEGNYAKFRNCKNKTNVRIAQSIKHNPDYVDEIEALLIRLGGHYRKFTVRGGEMATFTLKKPLSDTVRKALPAKLATFDLVAKLTPAQMGIFIDTFVKGDGHIAEEGGRIITQKDVSNLNVLQAMAVLSGQSSTKYDRMGRHDFGALYVAKNSKRAQRSAMQVWKITVDTVWCPQTSHGTWIARRNGRTFVTGNSRPNWARGPIGATVFTFKQFSISYVELATRMYRKDKVAFALMMLTLMAAAGIEGLPFAEDLEDIIDTIGQRLGYNTNTKRALRRYVGGLLGNDLGEIVLRGFSGIPGMPIDVAARMGMHNLLPGTSLLKPSETNRLRDIQEMVGPIGGVAEAVGESADALAQGKAGKAAEALLPNALKNFIKGIEMAQTGEYRDRQGRKVMDTTYTDALAKAAGFQPAKVAKESAKLNAIRQDVDLNRKVEDGIADRWARALADKDPAGVEQARQELRDWNARNPESPIRINMQQLQRRVKELRRSRSQRYTDTVPKELRRTVRDSILD